MSCYQLSDKHHASIAKYVQAQLGWPADKTQHFADRLKHCNAESVNYAHNEKKPAFKCKTNNFKTLDSQSYYDAICHWSYQSDENPNCLDYDIVESFLFSLVPDEF